MASNAENTRVTHVAVSAAKQPADEGKTAPGSSEASGDQVFQDYAALRDRFLRTTNALASAAHDLKTPLAILNGYVDLLQNQKLGPLNERQCEVLAEMKSNGQRLERYIQDFLTFSVLETGGMRLKYELGNMNSCISEVCRLWSNRFQEKGLALYFLPNEKLPNFEFDSAKVERIVSNLLENASKYTPSGGTVWMHAESYMWERRSANKPSAAGERRRRPVTTANAIKISVADTGPGISAEYHIEVFDDFFRLPEAERLSEGMGLGLSIARRLVSAMGGKIWVESDPGAGCKFSFILPFKPTTNIAKGKK
jgi:signal transduction histidine kinase